MIAFTRLADILGVFGFRRNSYQSSLIWDAVLCYCNFTCRDTGSAPRSSPHHYHV